MKSTRTDNIQSSPKSKHLSLIERQQIERWLNERVSVTEIANRSGRNKSSIGREIKRGIAQRTNYDLTKSYVYGWDVAQQNYEKNKGGGGRYPRLHSAHPLLQSLQRLITKNRLSPYAAMCVLQKQGHELDFCVKTLYNHIGRENFLIKSPCRKHKNLKGESIDNRPESINARKEAGHHEMDLVVGARGGKKVLLAITERVTRYQHIVLIKDKTQRSVIRAINRLERKLGKDTFSTIF